MDNVVSDADFNVDQLNWIIDAFKNTVERFSKAPFPQDPQEQLLGAVEAVFASWLNDRAVTYRKLTIFQTLGGQGQLYKLWYLGI